MKLTKIVVLLAHDDSLDVEGVATEIDCAIGQSFAESQQSNLFYEVRPQGTKEITLGSIDLSLEEGYRLEVANPEPEPQSH